MDVVQHVCSHLAPDKAGEQMPASKFRSGFPHHGLVGPSSVTWPQGTLDARQPVSGERASHLLMSLPVPWTCPNSVSSYMPSALCCCTHPTLRRSKSDNTHLVILLDGTRERLAWWSGKPLSNPAMDEFKDISSVLLLMVIPVSHEWI